MRYVFKYPLRIEDEGTVVMPEGARLLHVAVQEGSEPGPSDLQLWAEVEPERPSQERTVRIFGTGHAMPEDVPLHHVGTVQMAGGRLVWHVYEQRSPEHFGRGQLVAEAGNEPGWIGEAHGVPDSGLLPCWNR